MAAPVAHHTQTHGSYMVHFMLLLSAAIDLMRFRSSPRAAKVAKTGMEYTNREGVRKAIRSRSKLFFCESTECTTV